MMRSLFVPAILALACACNKSDSSNAAPSATTGPSNPMDLVVDPHASEHPEHADAEAHEHATSDAATTAAVRSDAGAGDAASATATTEGAETDFEEEAERDITASTLESEIGKLEKEVEK